MRYLDVCKNIIASFVIVILITIFMILISVWDTVNYKKQIECNNASISEYQKMTEEYKMRNEKLKAEIYEVRLKAFLKAYSNGTYIIEKEN